MNVYVNGRKISLKPTQAIGKGGEADVFDVGQNQALKLFKPPEHPDYQGLPQEQQAARDRLQLHQQKLRAFPQNLPQRVITPTALATDRTGKMILGYTMPLLKPADVLLKYGDRSFRQTGVDAQTVVQVFQDVHDTVSKLHFAGVVIGDFNDLNVLVRGTEAYFIDADSFQFSSYWCKAFTARFVDPLLCDAQSNQPMLQQPHNADSDWYAFAVMLMQCLLFVDPYGGVYKPKSPSQAIPHAARSLHRITVFHSEVRYPKPAIPYRVLPDELLHYFQQVFEQDRRGEFPRSLLDNLRWTTCLQCGSEHARLTCPNCTTARPQPVQSMTVVRGTVTANRRFQTEGVIVAATVENGQLYWLYHHQGEFRREDESVVLNGHLHPYFRWRLQGKTTLLGYQDHCVVLNSHSTPQRIAVDSLNAIAQLDVNASHHYWISQGQLQRNHSQNGFVETTFQIGSVLEGQTQFWVGEQFGFGFYCAGNLKVAFVFDAHKAGMNDQVVLPNWQGQLIHATCTFSAEYCWLFLTIQEQGQIRYRCVVVQANGAIAAIAQATEGDDHWLAMMGQKNTALEACACAVNHFLLAATDVGIIRVELQQQQLVHTKTFADTEPFVDSHSRLLVAAHGLFVVNPHEIYQLQIA